MTRQEYMDQYPEIDSVAIEIVRAAMDATNLTGIVCDWARLAPVLWKQADQLSRGTDWVNQHPINVCLIDKLAQLAREWGLDSGSLHRIDPSWAYQWLGLQPPGEKASRGPHGTATDRT